MKPATRIRICATEELTDGHYKKISVSYRNQPTSVLVLRFKGQCFAYINQCVHMPRNLDCLEDMIFDDSGQNLRCSMHGIIYDPCNGESLSVLCQGDKLTAIAVSENEQGIWIQDKRMQPMQS